MAIISLLPQHTNYMAKTTSDQTFVRETNLSSTLRLIHTQSPISRAQLAVITGLNKSTVSSLVDELLSRTLIHETGSNSVGAGRPATSLEINPQAGMIIGVELGVDFVSVAVTDFLGNILWRRKEDADPTEDQKKTLDQTLKIVKEAMTANKKRNSRFLGLGIAMPGTVDLNEGVLTFAPNLHWRNVPFRKIFSDYTKLNTFIENDANAAAIAEHLFGAARESRDFIFIFAGVGIGSGLFLNGHLYRGRNGYAGEIGHSPIMAEPSPTICHCGNRGCWETYTNQYSIIQRVQARLEVKRSSIISKLMAEQDAPLSISLIKQAADLGDEEAIESFIEAGHAMGKGFAGLINLFNPEKIILGGPLSEMGDYLLPAIKETIAHHSFMPDLDQQAEVLLSFFRQDASLIGAIAIVVDDVLSKPMNIERR
jgi:glucokinase-like ROK family protein